MEPKTVLALPASRAAVAKGWTSILRLIQADVRTIGDYRSTSGVGSASENIFLEKGKHTQGSTFDDESRSIVIVHQCNDIQQQEQQLRYSS
eukprot:scaffold36596_cov194-Skeletonema_dohrnii-CCMP3373.AAC.1